MFTGVIQAVNKIKPIVNVILDALLQKICFGKPESVGMYFHWAGTDGTMREKLIWNYFFFFFVHLYYLEKYPCFARWKRIIFNRCAELMEDDFQLWVTVVRTFINVHKVLWEPKMKGTEEVQSINITLDGEQTEMRAVWTCVR